MTVDIGRVSVQVDEVGGLGIASDTGLVQSDPLLLKLFDLAHIHVIDARRGDGTVRLAFLVISKSTIHCLVHHVAVFVLLFGPLIDRVEFVVLWCRQSLLNLPLLGRII